VCRASVVAGVVAFAVLAGPHVDASPAVRDARDGTLEIAGRTVRCGRVRNILDARLPNLGISIPDKGLLVMNPMLLRRYPESVRLFVFHHECGHHHVGGDELKADCWAVDRGIRDGWLDKQRLGDVCRSFGNAPATPTHPSAASRCRNLERCFASTVAKIAPAPTLRSGPTLVRSGSTQSVAGSQTR
jgi:hypothetical protein